MYALFLRDVVGAVPYKEDTDCHVTTLFAMTAEFAGGYGIRPYNTSITTIFEQSPQDALAFPGNW